MKLSPITLFVYNRPIHTKKTVEALKANKLASKSILYIYSDYPKKEEHKEDVKKVREYIHTVKGFKEIHIIERKQNYGLAKSIVEGVTEVINKYGSVIVLEDDLITSPMFLTFMNNMLETYKEEKKVYSITGYNYPPKLMKIPKEYKYDIYFSLRASSWGWATWKVRWDKADWEIKDYKDFIQDKQLQKEFNKGGDDMADMLISQMEGKLDSWAIRWGYTHFKNDACCVYPTKSYIDNIGMDGSGVHCGNLADNVYKNISLNNKTNIHVPNVIEYDLEILKEFRGIHKKSSIRNKLKKLYKKMSKNKNSKAVFKESFRATCPPILWDGLLYFYSKFKKRPPRWHIVKEGLVEGCSLFLNIRNMGFRKMVSGDYDSEVLESLRGLNLEGKIIYDIGAHIGYLSLCYSQLVGEGGKIFSFEPNPYNVQRFKKILRKNPLYAKNIDIKQLAISDANGETQFEFSDRIDDLTSSGSYLSNADTPLSREVYKRLRFKSLTVKTHKLDSLVQGGLPTPFLIKIDVEGAEHLVVKGGKDIIEKGRPVLIIEIHTIYNMYEILSFLQNLAYKVEILKKEDDGRCIIIAIPNSPKKNFN